MRLPRIALLVFCFGGAARAEEDRAGRAREELERELQNMVKLPAASVEVVFDGIDSTRYKLLEGSFALDDKPIPFSDGRKILYEAEVAPGKHTLTATLLYEAPAISHGSIKYKVPGKFIFHAQRGILMRVRTRIEVNDGAEPSKRLQLMGNAETDLRAKLEDSVLPPTERSQPEPAEKGAIRYKTTAALAEAKPEPEPELELEKKTVSLHRRRNRRSNLLVASPPLAASNDAVGGLPSPNPSHTDEARAGSEATSGEKDAGLPLAAVSAVSTPVERESPSPSAPRWNEAIGSTEIAIAAAALAPIALLLLAFARRRR